MIEKVLVCGAGQMGSWIVKKMVLAGCSVSVFDADPEKAKKLAEVTAQRAVSLGEVEALEPHLIFETISEDSTLKRQLFEDLACHLPKNTIFASNTSVLDPEVFLTNFDRKSRFACFHFYRPNSIVDVMPLEETDQDVVRELTDLATRMGEAPILLKKRHAGYLMSNILGAAADEALALLHDQVADERSIDQAWKGLLGIPIGILESLDGIGLDTSLAIRQARSAKDPENPKLEKAIAVLKEKVSLGALGRKAGQGFFTYETDPNA